MCVRFEYRRRLGSIGASCPPCEACKETPTCLFQRARTGVTYALRHVLFGSDGHITERSRTEHRAYPAGSTTSVRPCPPTPPSPSQTTKNQTTKTQTISQPRQGRGPVLVNVR